MGVGRQMEGLNTLSEAPVFFFFFETRLLFRVFLFSYVLLKY